MKKLILLTLFCVSMASISYAQLTTSLDLNSPFEFSNQSSTTVSANASAPADVIAVISLKGKVRYAKPGSRKFKKLKEGAILDKMGRIKLKKNSELRYLRNGSVQTFNSKGKHSIDKFPFNELVEKSEDDFLSYLTSASGWGGPGRRDGGQKDTTENASGHGEGVKLNGYSPKAGKWHAGPMIFKWTTKSDNGFVLNIYESGKDENPIFSKKTDANKLMIDLSKIKEMKAGESYEWQVTKDSGVEGVLLRSDKVEITVVNKSEGMKIITALEQSDDFKQLSNWQRDLRIAREFEASRFYSDAANTYKQAAGKYPNNELVQRVFGMFMERM